MIRKTGLITLILCLFLLPAAFSADMKIGYINMRRAFYEYKKTKDFQKELEEKDTLAKEEFEKKAENFRKMRDEIDMLSDKAKEKKQAELREKAKELDEYRKTKGEELIRWRDEKIREINKDLMDATGGFAKKNNYDIVLDKMAFVYSPEEYDITDKVLKEVNK